MTQIEAFGTAPDHSPVQAVALQGGGLVARVLTWGASLQSLSLEGGRPLVLGSHAFEAYLDSFLYHGAIVGPVANRIAGGRFALAGRAYDLDRNELGRTTLHGGAQGFGQRNWRLEDHGADWCRLALHHPDGLCGFPGPLEVACTYRLRDSALEVEISGTAQAQAVFAPAFHGYWNLDGGETVLDHQLTIAADRYTPVDAQMIPTGQAPVEGTAFDYRSARPAGGDLDHNFCLSDSRGPLREVARLAVPSLTVAIETTEPGLQVYTAGGNSSGRWQDLEGKRFGPHKGIALEPQLWPDALNRKGWPSPRIAAGETVVQRNRFVILPS